MEQYNEIHNKAHSHFHSKEMHSAAALALLILSLFLVAKVVTEVREWKYVGTGIAPMNTISVQGEGEVFAIADVATFNFSVIEVGDNAKDAQDKGAVIGNEAITYLRDNGVEEKDIKTTGYNVYPKYEYNEIACFSFPCPPRERELIGYEVNQSVAVKVRDTEKAGELLSGVGGIGVENISGLTFTIDDETALKREARQMAVKDAREKAEDLADDLDVKLVRVVNFNEFGSPRFAMFESKSFDIGMGGDSSVTPEIPLGENEITSQVSITYEIR